MIRTLRALSLIAAALWSMPALAVGAPLAAVTVSLTTSSSLSPAVSVTVSLIRYSPGLSR